MLDATAFVSAILLRSISEGLPAMPLYSLDGVSPETPGDGAWWLAPDAHLIGKVRIAPDVGSGSARSCAATMSGSRSGRAATSRKGACSTPIWLSAQGRGGLHHRPSRHPPWLRHRRQFPDRHGRDRAQRGAHRQEQPGRRQCAGHRGQGVPRQLADRRAPAKAIRTLDEAAAAGITGSAKNYVLRWKQFAAGMRRLDRA